jgi:tRNA pseudouridine38/39 synthase
MSLACKDFIGEHNFVQFCKFTEEYIKSGTIRKILNCEIKEEMINDEKMCYLVIEGSAFLWHQIRKMMATLKAIGRN